MIDLHFYPSPNGLKIAIMLEECGLPYRIVEVDILRGAQFEPEFLRISPNNRFRRSSTRTHRAGRCRSSSPGAILISRREVGPLPAGRLAGAYARCNGCSGRWAASGRWPGQAHHFRAFASEVVPYGSSATPTRSTACTACSDRQLADRDFLAGDYSIADMACWPWVVRTSGRPALEDFPDVQRWFESIRERPAVRRAYERGPRTHGGHRGLYSIFTGRPRAERVRHERATRKRIMTDSDPALTTTPRHSRNAC